MVKIYTPDARSEAARTAAYRPKRLEHRTAMSQLHLRLHPDVHARLRACAAEDEKTGTLLLNQIVETYLAGRACSSAE